MVLRFLNDQKSRKHLTTMKRELIVQVFAQRRSGVKTWLQHKFVTLHKKEKAQNISIKGRGGKAINSALCDAQIIFKPAV